MIRTLNLPSPTFRLDGVSETKVELYIKREDMIHPTYGGNKWRKLKYNLEAFKEGAYSELVTFGGPFSNHIAATAAVCAAERIRSVGIIRGTFSDNHNPTLLKAKEHGMQLVHVTKDAYRQKEQAKEIEEILSQLYNPYLIPEGGSNALALRGVGELMDEVHAEDISYDHIIVGAGTGTTAAGIIARAKNEKITVINVLKNESLADTIKANLPKSDRDWQVNNDYHFGGFAKTSDELVSFINNFYKEQGILLDPVYNGKGMYATLDMIRNGFFEDGTKILYIHTGGQQGITAYNYRNKVKGREITI